MSFQKNFSSSPDCQLADSRSVDSAGHDIGPAELIECSPKKGLRTVSLPFDMSAEYTPATIRQQHDGIAR